MADDRNRKSGNPVSKNEASTSHGKKSKTICTDLKYKISKIFKNLSKSFRYKIFVCKINFQNLTSENPIFL